MAKKLTAEEIRRARKNYNDRVRRANKRFEEATPEEKRVIIAKDVLAQLAIGKIKATPGEYLGLTSETYDALEDKPNAELCDIFKGVKSCGACALGSIFVSAVIFQDQLKAREASLDDSWFMRSYLDDNGLFSKRQLIMIENAFECSTIKPILDDYETEMKCLQFNNVNMSGRKRLERIMKNIIDNNGTFVP